MAFNVCTKEGKHVGITYGSAQELGSFHIGGNNRRIVRIALTDQRIEDGNFNYEEIRKGIAERHGARNLMRKIKEDALQEELHKYWEKEKTQMKAAKEGQQNLYRDFQPREFDEKFIYRLYHLKNRFSIKPYWLGEELQIQGFIFYDLDEGILVDEKTLLLEEPLKYIETTEKYKELKPTYSVIAERPEVSILGMGIGEGLLLGANLSDFGGRNHVHSTKFKLLSGNAIYKISVPIHIHAKAGMNLTMYIDEDKNAPIAFICDEVLYTS